MKSGIVPVSNIARLSKASKALLNRAPGAPGIAILDGAAGYGKSTASAWLANQHPSIYVRAIALWTPSAMLGAISRELRIPTGGSCSQMVERIVTALSNGGQTVFVDELDYIVRQTRLVETLRDLHDLATVPLILIGETGVVERLMHLQRFTSRIAEHVEFQPLDIADTAMIARELCEIEVKPDLLQHIHTTTRGNCRMTVVSLARAEQIAKAKGLGAAGFSDIGKKPLFTGDASPAPRGDGPAKP